MTLCPQCEREIPADAPRSRCPHCLFTTANTPFDSLSSENCESPDSRYRNEREISRGGMGRILLARDEQIGREVAVKELLPELNIDDSDAPSANATTNPSRMSKRFVHEAQVTGQLEHPYIVPVYEIGFRPDRTPFYTMRYVRGRTLSECLEGSKTLDDRLALLSNFLHACQAIAFAHSKSIIHRDLKPSNILIGEFGETVVIDWGLAKSLRERTEDTDSLNVSPTAEYEATRLGEKLGSPYYMAPEQISGTSQSTDTGTDVFSLGVVLYQIRSGAKPFEGDDLDGVFDKILHVEPRRPRSLDSRIPPDLEQICLRSLSKDADARYPSARELALDLERFLNGALVETYNYSVWERLRRFYRKHRAVVLTGIGAIGVLAIVIAASISRLQP